LGRPASAASIPTDGEVVLEAAQQPDRARPAATASYALVPINQSGDSGGITRHVVDGYGKLVNITR
jgi:hypothetical protein